MKLFKIFIFLILSYSSASPVNQLSEHTKTKYFEVYYTPQDQTVVQEMLKDGETFLSQLEKDFKHTISTSIMLKVYPDLESFHLAIGNPLAPAWITGQQEDNLLLIVSPNNPGPVHTRDSLMKGYKVGLVTEIIYDTYKNHDTIPRWLHQGVALYKSQYYKTYNFPEKLATLKELESIGKKGIDQSVAFNQCNGFIISCSMVEFIDKTYGWEKILELLADYANFEKILTCSQEEFNNRWMAFLGK